jgi:hypothetical protein
MTHSRNDNGLKLFFFKGCSKSFQLDHLRRVNAKIRDEKDSNQTVIVRRNSSDDVGERLDAFRNVGLRNDAVNSVTFLDDVEVDDDAIDLDVEVDAEVFAVLGNSRSGVDVIKLFFARNLRIFVIS